MVNFGVALQKVLRKFAIASSPSDRIQAEIQRYHTGLGAEFGQPLTHEAITFAVRREPIAYLLTFHVAHDVFDKWFEVEPLEKSVDKEKFNEQVQKVLLLLNAKDVFTQAAVFERAYGWSIIVIGYQDKAETLKEPVNKPEKIVNLQAYAPTMITEVKIDENEENPGFGLPQTYKVRIAERREVEVHCSRVIHLATRLLDNPWKGMSVLEPVWDDLTVIRNIAWGMGQTLYRYGSGFPVVTVKGATREQLREWAREWGPLTAQTSLFKSDKQEIEFKGLEGRALDPEPYYSAIMERISAGSGIPKPMIIGAQAGQLAGSEVNEREYFKLISDCQSRYEPVIMSLIDDLMRMGQVPDVHYRIKWLGGFEINPRDKAAAELDRVRALALMTNWMTVNEIRQLEGLERIPGGDVVLGLSKLQGSVFSNNASLTSRRKLQLERKFGKPVDKLLADKIAAGHSVNKICRDLGISTQTFYSWAEEYGLKQR